MNAQPTTPADPARRPPGRVLVTGATGLLGSNVTAQLLAAGAEVLALARSAERASHLLPAHERLRIVEGDITRVDGFAAQLHGVGAVVHTAAYFREYYQPGGRDQDLLQRTNVDAAEQLLRAAADAGVPVVVHVSSATTVGTAAAGQPSGEDTPPDAGWERNGYRASKIRAELIIQAWPESSGVRVPVIVPAWMWGPGDAAPTASGALFLAVARGRHPRDHRRKPRPPLHPVRRLAAAPGHHPADRRRDRRPRPARGARRHGDDGRRRPRVRRPAPAP
jgi:dihydroflavonol-4-reductase